MILTPFDPVAALLLAALTRPQPQEATVAQAAAAQPAAEITTRDVALRLFEEGYMPETLPRREEDLALAILKAFEGKGVRFGDIPARKSDFAQIRKQLGIVVIEVQRYERSLEADRYRPAFVKPVGRM